MSIFDPLPTTLTYVHGLHIGSLPAARILLLNARIIYNEEEFEFPSVDATSYSFKDGDQRYSILVDDALISIIGPYPDSMAKRMGLNPDLSFSNYSEASDYARGKTSNKASNATAATGCATMLIITLSSIMLLSAIL